jgi:putative flippase GtrA
MTASRAHRDSITALVKFLCVGSVNTAFAYAVYAGSILVGFEPWLANLIALILGILFSFISIGKFVFGTINVPSFFRFVASWAVVYAVQTVCIYLLIHQGLGAILAGLVVLPFAAITSFVIQRFLVFR